MPPKRNNSNILSSRGGNRDSKEGFIHLTSNAFYFPRAQESAQDYLIAHFKVPKGIVTGDIKSMNSSEYRMYLLKEMSSTIVPDEPPAEDAIDLPDSVEADIQAMAEGVDPDDQDLVAEVEEAQEECRRSYRHDIRRSLLQARQDIIDNNEMLKAERIELVKEFVKHRDFVEAKGWLVNQWPSSDIIRLQIQQHPDFKSVSAPEPSSIADIFRICHSLFSDIETNPAKRRENARKRLESLQMSTANGFEIYVRDVNEAYDQLKSEGGDVEESIRIEWFRNGLHDTPFAAQKTNHSDPVQTKNFPTAYNEFELLMKKVHQEWLKTNASRARHESDHVLQIDSKLKKPAKNQVKKPTGGSKVPMRNTDSHQSASKSDFKSCSTCGRNHPGECADVEAVRKKLEREYAEELARKLEQTEKLAAELETKRKNKASRPKVSFVKLNVLNATSCIDCDEVADENMTDKTYVPTERDIIPALSLR
jgi:hypothetical protein